MLLIPEHINARAALCKLMLAIALVPLVIWAAWLYSYGVDVIRVEQWFTPFTAIREFFAGNGSAEALFRQHNESRKVIPTGLSTALALANGSWNTHLELVIGSLLCVCLLVSMGLVLRATPRHDTWRGALVLLLFSLILWSPNTWHFHTNSITFERLIPELCLLLGMLLFLSGFNAWLQALGYAFLALVSQFSFAGGMVIWPFFLLFLVARFREQERRAYLATGLFVLAFVGALALYFWEYARPGQTRPLTDVLQHPLQDIAMFFFMVLGRPYADVFWPGAGVGAFVFIVFLTSALCGLNRPISGKAWLAWFVLGLYSLSQAALITIGRLPMSMGNATRTDYVVLGSYLLVSAVVLMGLRERGEGVSARAQVMVSVFVSGVMLGALTGSPVARMKEQAYALREAKACLQLSNLMDLEQCGSRRYRWPQDIAIRLRDADKLGIMRPGLADRIVSRGDVPLYGEVTASFWSRTGAMHFAGWAVVNDRIADAVVITAAAEGKAETVIGVFRSGVRSNVTAGPEGRRFTDAGWGGDIPKQRLIYDTAKRN